MGKKLASLLLAAIMLLALFAGCSNNGGGGTTTTGTTAATSTTATTTTKVVGVDTTSAATTKEHATTATDIKEGEKFNPPGTLPVVNEEVTLSFAMPVNPVVEDRETNELFKYLQTQTGVTFTLDEYPADEFITKVDLMMAAGGKDLPNVIAGTNILVGVRSTWGEAGFVQDLKPYYDQLYFLPIAFDNCEYTTWDTAVMQVTSPDGAVYGLPSYAESPNDRVSNGRINFYLPWVEKAGMLEWDENGEFMTRVDQLLDYYEAVKTGDFNGNGKNDEIALTGYALLSGNDNSGYSATGAYNLKNAFLPMFTKNNGADAFFIDTTANDVKYNFTTEEYKEALTFIKGLYDNGYLDPLTFTQDATAMTAQITAETMTIASFLRISASNLNLTTVPPSTDFSWCSALSAPGETERFQYYGKAIAYIQYLVTSSCEEVEAAVRVGDYWGSEECSFINNCGFEGIDYDWVADLDDQSKWGNAWGWGPEDTYVRRTTDTGGRASWGTMQNVWMVNQGVSCLNYAWATQGGADKTLPTYEESVRNANRILYNLTLTNASNALAAQVYTEEEIALKADVGTAIANYANECFTRFVTGDMNLEKDWDSYVSDLEAMGLQDLVAMENTCYDRMYK